MPKPNVWGVPVSGQGVGLEKMRLGRQGVRNLNSVTQLLCVYPGLHSAENPEVFKATILLFYLFSERSLL